MNSSAIYSKTGKGVQEASGKTSHLSRADRAVLSAIDGKSNMGEVAKKFDKLAGAKFDALIQQLDKEGFIREVSSGAQSAPSARSAAPPKGAPPPPAKAASADDGDGLDFTQAIKISSRAPAAPAAPKPPAPRPTQVDLAATARAGAERKAEEDLTLDYRSREELQAKMKAEFETKAKADARAKAEANAAADAKAAAEAKGRAEAEAKARAEAEAKTHAEADAKVKAAREAAVRMATEVKAKAEAEGKAKTDAAEREKARMEAELNAKLDVERKAREDAERRATEAAELARKELEEKAKLDADEMRQRLEAEMKAKLDAERKVREEEDRKRREEEDRKRKEEDERRAKEDAERKAREEAERKKRDEEERKRKEEDERRRTEEDERRRTEVDERRAKEDAERKAREEADRKKREDEDRNRKEEDRKRKEDDERRAKEAAERRTKEEAEKRSREEADRKKRDEEERKRREEDDRRRKEDDARRAKEGAERRAKDEAETKTRAAASASLPAIEPVVPPPPPPAAPAVSSVLGDDLLADLESFGKREEEEQKAKEEAERQAKEAAARKAKDDAERRAKAEAERKAKEEAERKAKEEAERKDKEEAERKEREEEERLKQEEEERKRKTKEAQAAKQAAEQKAKSAASSGAAKGGDDVDVKDDDLDLDEIKRDHKALAKRAAAREQPISAVVATSGRPRRWGKPVAIAVFALLVVGIGVLHVLPVSTADYEKGASEAFGVPVKIGSARMSVITGVELKFENVAIGDAAKIRLVRGIPDIGSLIGERKSFSRVELEGVSMEQSQIADALLGKAAGTNFRVGRVLIKQLSLDGPLKLPPLDVEATVSGDGSLQTVRLSGPEKLLVQLSPKGSEMAFEINAASLALPFVPALNLSDFGMKGTANRAGVTSAEFDGRAYDGVISGTARIRWGASWTVEGEVRARAVKVAVFAPALVSEGKVEGRATYTMSGNSPGQLYERARMEGEFKIDKGVLGSFDLTRALQTGGAQSAGRTVFNELNGKGVYDKGVTQLRDISISAGAMNAGGTLDIDANGGISGRIAADVKTPNQTLRAVLNISGKLQDPVIRK